MTRNMGAFDRGLRAFVVAPAAIVVAVIVGAGTVAGIVLFVVAAIMLTTAGTGFCPNYTLLGISMSVVQSGSKAATHTAWTATATVSAARASARQARAKDPALMDFVNG